MIKYLVSHSSGIDEFDTLQEAKDFAKQFNFAIVVAKAGDDYAVVGAYQHGNWIT